MPGFCIQFHATHDELVAFVTEWATEYALFLAATTFPPWRVRALSIADVEGQIAQPSVSDVIVFTEARPDLTTTDDQLEFWDRNPGRLELSIGQLKDDALFESCLSTMIDSKIWRKLARHLRHATMKGAYQGHRYTVGAESLVGNGFKMVTITGVPLELP
ncbi:hypothetical protein ACNOYE_15240 [Nannocystaceae bacterium ST9]